MNDPGNEYNKKNFRLVLLISHYLVLFQVEFGFCFIFFPDSFFALYCMHSHHRTEPIFFLEIKKSARFLSQPDMFTFFVCLIYSFYFSIFVVVDHLFNHHHHQQQRQPQQLTSNFFDSIHCHFFISIRVFFCNHPNFDFFFVQTQSVPIERVVSDDDIDLIF